MTLNAEYLASVFSSTIRYMTPILLVTLSAGICTKVRVFNIALEGGLLASAFFAFLTQYFLRNIWLAVLVGMLTGMFFNLLVSVFVVKLRAQPMIVGMALNTFSRGLTTFMLQLVFHTKGVVSDVTMTGISKVTLPVVSGIPVLGTMFKSLTAVDYAAFAIAVLIYVFMYKTATGFRLRAIGINAEAARSLGVAVERYQMLAVTLSGCTIGLAGCLLSLGSVVLFIQNISSARGYIALAANALSQGHPLGAMLSSALFGFTTALSYVLQNTAAKQQLLNNIPYISTIIAMAVYFAVAKRRRRALAEAEERRPENEEGKEK